MSDDIPSAILEQTEQLARLRAEQPAPADGPEQIRAQVRRFAIESLMREHEISAEDAERMLSEAQEADAEPPEVAAARRAHERSEREAARLSRILHGLDVPVAGDLIEDMVRGKLLATPAATVVREWLSSPRRWLALIGDIGTGKTVAAVAAAVAMLRSRHTVAYVRESALARAYGSTTLTHEERWARWAAVDLLIVDELGQIEAERSERGALAVGEMLDARTRAGRTILAGNMSADAWAKRYGTRVVDRFRQHGRTFEAQHAEGQRSLRARAIPARTDAARDVQASAIVLGAKS